MAMKKMVALILLITVMISYQSSALASIDLSAIKNNDLYKMDMDDDGDVYISLNFEEPLFYHANSIDEYPSYVYTDIIILDYFSTSPRAVWRMWVNYSASKYMGLNAISIVMDNTEYEFLNVGGTNRMKDFGTNTREEGCIVFGIDNADFWVAFLLKCEDLNSIEQMENWSFPMTLHGLIDVETTLDVDALLELYAMGEAMLKIAGIDGMMLEGATEVKTRSVF